LALFSLSEVSIVFIKTVQRQENQFWIHLQNIQNQIRVNAYD